MKKLFVLAVAAIMVLSLTAVSMAEVTTGGEFNFIYNAAPEASKGTISDAKVTFNAEVSDSVGAYAEIKASSGAAGVNIGDYYGTVKFDAGTLKVGSYEYKFDGDTDILTKIITPIKGAAVVEFAPQLGEGITASVLYNLGASVAPVALPEGAYGLKVGYATDTFGAEVGIVNTNNKSAETSATIINAFYNLDALKLYVNNETGTVDGAKDQKDTIIGALYTLDNLSGRFEYDLAPEKDNPMAVALALKNEGVTYKVTQKNEGSTNSTELKMTVNF